MGTMAVTVLLLRMIKTPDRHANLVLHVRMKGAILGSVDLAMQVSTIILVHTTRSVIGQEIRDRARSDEDNDVVEDYYDTLQASHPGPHHHPHQNHQIRAGAKRFLFQKARGSALFPFPTSAFKMLPGIELSNGVSKK